MMLFRFIFRFVTKEFIALLTTNLKLLLLNLLMLISDIIFLLFIVNPDVFFVLLILFSLSLKFSFLLSINFLLLNFVSISLNIISLFLRFCLNPHPCQLSWGSPKTGTYLCLFLLFWYILLPLLFFIYDIRDFALNTNLHISYCQYFSKNFLNWPFYNTSLILFKNIRNIVIV